MKTEKKLGKKIMFFRKNRHENVHQISRKNESKLNEGGSIVFALGGEKLKVRFAPQRSDHADGGAKI